MDETTKEFVFAALRAMADPANEREADIVDALCKAGLDAVTAEKLLALVPLAFGRVLIAHIAEVEMSDDFHLFVEGKTVIRSLKSEPIFLVALQLATEMFHSGSRELFEPAATISAELKAVNKALNAGVDLDGGVLRDPVFLRIDGAEWETDAG